VSKDWVRIKNVLRYVVERLPILSALNKAPWVEHTACSPRGFIYKMSVPAVIIMLA